MEPLAVVFEGLSQPTPEGSNAPDWKLAGSGATGAYCDVGCGKVQPIAFDSPDIVCAVCWGVLLTLGRISEGASEMA